MPRDLCLFTIRRFSPIKVISGSGLVVDFLEKNSPTVLLVFNLREDIFSHVLMPSKAFFQPVVLSCHEYISLCCQHKAGSQPQGTQMADH